MARKRGTIFNDTMNGANARDVMFGLAGNDKIAGDGGNDDIYGHGGRDRLLGGAGDDILVGGIGDDKLYGGTGSDALHGGGGSDTLTGGAAPDYLDGDAGADVYRFRSVAEADGDSVVFQDGVDVFDFSGLGLTFSGGVAFSGVAGEITYSINNDDPESPFTSVLIDADGDAIADAAFDINGSFNLTHDDFVL